MALCCEEKMRWDYGPQKAPEDKEGFVYRITERSTGKIYVGIKKFWATKKLKPLKGKKNKRHRRVESDWRTYNSSNKELQMKIKANPSNYSKEIWMCCDSVTNMKAMEAYIQLDYYLSGKWDTLFNEVINLRLRIRKGCGK